MDWKDQAACAGHEHPEWWFPERNETHKVRLAKAVCAECPVRLECREAGSSEQYGIWGGLSVGERAAQRVPREIRCEMCGTEFTSTYVAKFCSDRCRRFADRAYHREYQRENTARVTGARLDQGHGTRTRYVKGGCRCPACKCWYRDYQREYKRRYREAS